MPLSALGDTPQWVSGVPRANPAGRASGPRRWPPQREQGEGSGVHRRPGLAEHGTRDTAQDSLSPGPFAEAVWPLVFFGGAPSNPADS